MVIGDDGDDGDDECPCGVELTAQEERLALPEAQRNSNVLLKHDVENASTNAAEANSNGSSDDDRLDVIAMSTRSSSDCGSGDAGATAMSAPAKRKKV